MARIVADHDLCTGCMACLLACSFQHYEVNNPKRARLYILRNTRDSRNKVFTCRQCKKAPCEKACPENAIKKNGNEVLIVDWTLCTNCNKCVEACSLEAMFIDPVTEKAIKCDLCGDNDPQCITACPTNALGVKGK
ncbi:MAG: 4Fe-4S dicluster domain-containing protein [Promethearchaeota archaeon]